MICIVLLWNVTFKWLFEQWFYLLEIFLNLSNVLILKNPFHFSTKIKCLTLSSIGIFFMLKISKTFDLLSKLFPGFFQVLLEVFWDLEFALPNFIYYFRIDLLLNDIDQFLSHRILKFLSVGQGSTKLNILWHT